MRDLWVDIPGYGAAKINAGLELGGVPLMTQTVEALLGQHIDHTVMLDFQGFAAMTDALGGVDVDIKQPFTGTVDDFVHFPRGREPAQRAHRRWPLSASAMPSPTATTSGSGTSRPSSRP